MKLIGRQPGQILRCVCGKQGDRPDCDVHRRRAFIEFTIALPAWWWKLRYRWLDRDTRSWGRR